MRSLQLLIAALVATHLAFPAVSTSAQQRELAATAKANRSAVAPVRIARASHEEPVTESSPSAPGRSNGSLPLAPASGQKSGSAGKPAPPSGSRAITTVLGSLGVVIGLFFLVAWFTRQVRPKGLQTLPQEVVEVLGRVPLAGRQQMHLVRVGGKLLLLSVTPTGAETLTEITDREEVDRLSSLCQMSQPSSISATFRQVLSQFEKEPAAADGFEGETPNESADEPVNSRSRRRPVRSAR